MDCPALRRRGNDIRQNLLKEKEWIDFDPHRSQNMMARLYQFLVLALASYPIIAFPVTFYPTSSGTNGVTTDSVQLTENIEIYYGLPFAAPRTSKLLQSLIATSCRSVAVQGSTAT